jgi:phosphoserine phosphatase RsbU/P
MGSLAFSGVRPMHDSGPITPAIELWRNGRVVANYPLAAGRLSIGRSPSNDIRLEDLRISRRHAIIDRRPDGTFVLIDLQSHGGSHLNGWRVTPYLPVALSDMSKIRLVDYELVFHQPIIETRKWPGLGEQEREDDRYMVLKVSKPVAAHPSCRSAAGADDVSGAYRHLLEVSRILGGGSDLYEQLERALDDLLGQFPRAEGGVILAPDQNGILSPLAHSRRERIGKPLTVALTGNLARQALDAAEAMLVTEVPREPPVDNQDIAYPEPIRAWLCVPLLGLEGRPVGLLQLFSLAFQPDFKAVQLARLRCQENAMVDLPCCIPLIPDDLDRLVEWTQSLGLAMEFHRIELQAGDEACREIQSSLDNTSSRELPGLLFDSRFVPEGEFRASIREFIPHLPDRAGGETPPGGTIVIGDVAGKGIRAALIMADVQLEIRRLLLAGWNLPDVLSRLNWLLTDLGGEGNCVRAILVDIDFRTYRLTVASAGHDPLVVRRSAGLLETLGGEQAAFGPPLGITPDPDYGTITTSLSLNDSVFLMPHEATRYLDNSGPQSVRWRKRAAIHPPLTDIPLFYFQRERE